MRRFPCDEINIYYSNLAQSTPQSVRRRLSAFILKTVNLTKRNREKTSQKRPFLAKISYLNTGICGLGRHHPRPLRRPKVMPSRYSHPGDIWGGAGGFGLVKSTSPVAVPSPQNGQKNSRKFGPAATLWQVCGAMPATPEAIKSTTDAAGHAGENRISFIGFDGLEMDSITTFPLSVSLIRVIFSLHRHRTS